MPAAATTTAKLCFDVRMNACLDGGDKMFNLVHRLILLLLHNVFFQSLQIDLRIGEFFEFLFDDEFGGGGRSVH